MAAESAQFMNQSVKANRLAYSSDRGTLLSWPSNMTLSNKSIIDNSGNTKESILQRLPRLALDGYTIETSRLSRDNSVHYLRKDIIDNICSKQDFCPSLQGELNNTRLEYCDKYTVGQVYYQFLNHSYVVNTDASEYNCIKDLFLVSKSSSYSYHLVSTSLRVSIKNTFSKKSHCEEVLYKILDKEKEIMADVLIFTDILRRAENFSNFNFNYTDSGYSIMSCVDAYKQWLCSQEFHMFTYIDVPSPNKTQETLLELLPCNSVCTDVEKRCPYFLPTSNSYNGGQPAFVCGGYSPNEQEYSIGDQDFHDDRECCFEMQDLNKTVDRLPCSTPMLKNLISRALECQNTCQLPLNVSITLSKGGSSTTAVLLCNSVLVACLTVVLLIQFCDVSSLLLFSSPRNEHANNNALQLLNYQEAASHSVHVRSMITETTGCITQL